MCKESCIMITGAKDHAIACPSSTLYGDGIGIGSEVRRYADQIRGGVGTLARSAPHGRTQGQTAQLVHSPEELPD